MTFEGSRKGIDYPVNSLGKLAKHLEKVGSLCYNWAKNKYQKDKYFKFRNGSILTDVKKICVKVYLIFLWQKLLSVWCSM